MKNYNLTKNQEKLNKWDPDECISLFGPPEPNYNLTHIHIFTLDEKKTILDPSKEICIQFNYPAIMNEDDGEPNYKNIFITFKNKKGFTKKDFIDAIKTGYREIAKENRFWGHCLEDLVFEGAEKVDGVWTLLIGS
jgi:hypothetical protein